MQINRRRVLELSGYALTGSLFSASLARAAEEMKTLHLLASVGKPAIAWTVLDVLRPGLQQALKGPVVVQAVTGHDGLDALHEVQQAGADEPRLFGTGVMSTQYAWRVAKADVRLESLMPIAKVTNGFSLTLFAKQGSALKSWADLASAPKPLKLSSLQRHTAAYFAVLMVERKGGLAPDVVFHDTIGEVIDDVTAGRSPLGVANTTLVATKQDQLQPIITFGAQRNAMLSQTPTFAEVTGDSKLAYTESIGVFASPKLDPALADRLIKAFMVAGNDMSVQGMAEAAHLPLAVSGPEILTETMARNEGVLKRVLE
jgi:tripartite-type tricarboxylate transporter receptor subunit TctC